MKNKMPSMEIVEKLRRIYPVGTRVILISIKDDPFSTLKTGDKGEVTLIDDFGTAHINWDCGSSLGLVYNVDFFVSETETAFESGEEMWNENVETYGKYGASRVCGYYLDRFMQKELSQNDSSLARELFIAMYEGTAEISCKRKLVYPYEFERAKRFHEEKYYTNSRIYNNECIRAIDTVIKKSCYKTNHYNLDIAAMRAVAYYGFPRIMMALARWLQRNCGDGRFSETNKQWAGTVDVPENVFDGTPINSHPILIDSFITHVRDLYNEMSAYRFTLPGKAESGEFEKGYEIIRSITFNDNRGFAIGRQLDANDMYACWIFTVINGKRDDFNCVKNGDEKTISDTYITLVMVFLDNNEEAEIVR